MERALERSEARRGSHDPVAVKALSRYYLLPLGLVFPLFFILSGKIYYQRDEPIYDSGGVLTAVPLPFSLIATAAAILLLGGYRRALPGIRFILFFLGAMLLGFAFLGGGLNPRKLILLLQFLVPAGALVLGLMLDAADQRSGSLTWLFLVPVFITLQLWWGYVDQDTIALNHDMYFFSIYQHRQFVPSIFVSAYMIALFTLWDSARWRTAVLATMPIIACYTVVSLSTLTMGILFLGTLILLQRRPRSLATWLLLALVVSASALGVAFNKGLAGKPQLAAQQKFSILAPQAPAAAARGLPALHVPVNLQMRLHDWALFGRGILESPQAALFGHAEPIDRAIATSAHNYYLDLIYNFGLIGLAPLVWLIVYTLRLLWKNRARLQAELPLLGLAFVALYLILVDNNFKVTFRQPYPGIFGFVLWGLLISRLTESRAELPG